MKKYFSILLILIMVFSLCACNSDVVSEEVVTTIKFSQSNDELKNLDGKQVKINGFMSLLSPLDGKLVYLMNMPFQNCPYCVPNTNTLANTIAVQGENIEFTQQPVEIVGKLVFGEFVDGYGYEYPYRIEDATIKILDEKTISEQMRVYYTLSENDYIGEIYTALSNLDMVAYHKEYQIPAEEFDSMGEIPFDRYQEIHDTVTKLNTNGEYNDFIELLNKTKSVMNDVNASIVAKEHDKFATYQKSVDELFQNFFDFISKYEM